MSAAAANTRAAHTAADPAALRVVLFGMPDAGKSSLLGSLVQASEIQQRSLQGRLIELPDGLHELRTRVYESGPRETLEEIAPYPVTFEALPKGRSSEKLPVVLFDCNGQVANDLLTRRRKLERNAGALARAVLGADVLMLVVDAAASPSQTDADLNEFVRFLQMFQAYRGRAAEVGGLPVFLVLSKSDLLVRPGDTAETWTDRVKKRLKQVEGRFIEFLEENEKTDIAPVVFGSIDLHVRATAVRRPALADAPAQPKEPWGVAELFHECLTDARLFRDRRLASARRLTYTVTGALSLVLTMGALAVGLVATHEQIKPPVLVGKLESYRSREGQTPSARLSEPLQRKISELTDLKQDPEFERLSPEDQEFITTRLQELEEYQRYKDALTRVRGPADARSEDELTDLERRLKDDLAPPATHQVDWRQTEAVLLRDKWLEDIKALRAAVIRVEGWYRELRTEGERLLLFVDRGGEATPTPWTEWAERSEKLTSRAERPPYRATDRLPDSRQLPSARALTYAPVFSFVAVDQARVQWDRTRNRLERVRDIATALGLIGDANSRSAPLRIPEPPRFRVAQVSERLEILRRHFPKWADWSLTDLPDAITPEIRRAATASHENLLIAGQLVILDQLQGISPDGRETPARWRSISDWLPTAADLRDWRELALLLGRLSDPRSEDPVAALASFLRQDRFLLDLRSLRLRLPDSLRSTRLRLAGRFTVYHRPTDGGATVSHTYKLEGDPQRDARAGATTLTLAPEGETGIVFRPGDYLWADVSLRDDAGGDWKLTWTLCKSQVYQFERLARTPRLHSPMQEATAGELAEGVTLTVLPERGLPRVPELMPVVRLEKR